MVLVLRHSNSLVVPDPCMECTPLRAVSVSSVPLTQAGGGLRHSKSLLQTHCNLAFPVACANFSGSSWVAVEKGQALGPGKVGTTRGFSAAAKSPLKAAPEPSRFDRSPLEFIAFFWLPSNLASGQSRLARTTRRTSAPSFGLYLV